MYLTNHNNLASIYPTKNVVSIVLTLLDMLLNQWALAYPVNLGVNNG